MTGTLAAGAVLAKGAGSAAGPLGLVVVLLLAVATVLLIRNMDKRLRRLPRDFGTADPRVAGPTTPRPPAAPGPEGAAMPGPDLPSPRLGPDERPDRPA